MLEKLKEEFIKKFTISGSSGKSLACAKSGDEFWDWITENFVPVEAIVRQGEVQPVLRADIEEKYNELIMAVAKKFTNETRHETALRYIKEAGKLEDNTPCKT